MKKIVFYSTIAVLAMSSAAVASEARNPVTGRGISNSEPARDAVTGRAASDSSDTDTNNRS